MTWDSRETDDGFEVEVYRLVTRGVAYVWRKHAPGFPQGRRYRLQRTLVSGPTGEYVSVEVGTRLRVVVSPEQPDRITFVQIVVRDPEHVLA